MAIMVGYRRVEIFVLAALVFCFLPGTWAQEDSPSSWLPIREKLPYDVQVADTKLVHAMRDAMIEGKDVSKALDLWFKGKRYKGKNKAVRKKSFYDAGIDALRDVKPLPPTVWPKNPAGVELVFRETIALPAFPGVKCRIVEFTVEKVRQYGILLEPKAAGEYPLVVYMHGAAFGVPAYAIEAYARIAREGYAVAVPSMRGEPLFAGAKYSTLKLPEKYKSDGQIENLIGEVSDGLGMAVGAMAQPNVRSGKYAVIGHSFGSGSGLLMSARDTRVACVISYDAWLVNPFRYYWDRMSGGSNNWLSWEDYCKAPTPAQLKGLKARSLVHNADKITAPLLLFMGGGYYGSVFHRSHDDLVTQLKAHKKEYSYVIVPDGGHNFVLYAESEPAQYAWKLQMEMLKKHLPPGPVEKKP